MKRLCLALLAALCLTGTSYRASAQAHLDPGLEERALERGEITGQATRRITVVLAGIVGDQEIAVARTPETLAAAVTLKVQEIADARAELQAIHADLTGLPPITTADGPDELRGIEQGGRNAAVLALKADAILESLQTIPAAVQTRDQARFDAAYRSVSGGAVLMMEAQAMMTRNQAALAEPGSPLQAQAIGLACFEEGQAAMQAGMTGLRDRALAAIQLGDAETCVREKVARARSILQGEIPPRDPVLARLRLRTAPLDAAVADTLEDGADLLSRIKEALVANQNSGVMAATFNPDFTDFTSRIQQLAIQQREAMADAR